MSADRPAGLKWNYFEPDVLPAWVAEMDYGLAPPIAEALHAAVDRGDTGYFYPAAMEAAATAACGFWGDRLGWRVEPEIVAHVPDVVEGIRRAIVHLTKPGSPVILPTPVYFPFFSMVERAGRELLGVPSKRDAGGHWSLDIDGIERAFSAGAGSIVLCNPWNPVGRSLTADEVGSVLEVAAAHGGRVIADEIHSALTFPGHRHTVAAGIAPDLVVTVTAASKAWNLPGLKAAQVVLTNDQDLAAWQSYFTPDKTGVGTFGLIAAAAGYADGREWLDEVLARLDGARRLLEEALVEKLPGAVSATTEATYLAWIDLRAYGVERPAAHLLETARVGLSEGADFGPGGEGHVRLNFATTEAVLAEIVDRVAVALAG